MCAHAIWHDQIETTKYGMVICEGRSVFIKGHHAPCPKGAGPQRLQTFWNLLILEPPAYTHAHTAMVVNPDDRTIFTRSTTPAAMSKKICGTNVDPRSVCGS